MKYVYTALVILSVFLVGLFAACQDAPMEQGMKHGHPACPPLHLKVTAELDSMLHLLVVIEEGGFSHTHMKVSIGEDNETKRFAIEKSFLITYNDCVLRKESPSINGATTMEELWAPDYYLR